MALKLHIGTHKTATTLLQQFAHRHRDKLQECGLDYPCWNDWLGLRDHYAHHDWAHAIADNSRLIGRQGLERFRALMQEASQERDVLISAEPLYRYLLQVQGQQQGPKAARNAYVRRVGDWLRDIEVEVIVVYRRPDDFAASMYGEHVLQTNFAGNLEQFIAKKPHLFDYGWQTRLWEKHVGPVRHLCYERLRQDDIVTAFFGHLGIDVANWERPAAVNESKDPAVIEFKRRANAELGGSGNTKHKPRRLDKLSVDDVLANAAATRPRSLWPSQRAEQDFLETALERFAATPYWDPEHYAAWDTGPAEKTYMEDWLADMKD